MPQVRDCESSTEEQLEYFRFQWEQIKMMVDIMGREEKNLTRGQEDEVVGLETYTALIKEVLLK